MKRAPTPPVIDIKVVRLTHGRGLALPSYQSAGAAGMDLLAAVGTPQTIAPGQRALIPTALILELPAGYEAQVRPRSGLALKHAITVLNSPGTIRSQSVLVSDDMHILLGFTKPPSHHGAHN
jgi:dUTP pyrophosphatase